MEKQTAHNELEVKTLIKESFAQGTEDKYHGTKWFKHDSGDFICESEIELTEFVLHTPDGSSTTVEV